MALLFLKLALEMAFNIFTSKRISRFGQYHRMDDLIAFQLCGEKRAVFRQFLVDEFHLPAVFKFLDPLVVCHIALAPNEQPTGTFAQVTRFVALLTSSRARWAFSPIALEGASGGSHAAETLASLFCGVVTACSANCTKRRRLRMTHAGFYH